jgi:hypothetical protein
LLSALEPTQESAHGSTHGDTQSLQARYATAFEDDPEFDVELAELIKDEFEQVVAAVGLPAEGTMEWTEQLDAAMRDASPITHLSADDPPIYLRFGPDRPVNRESAPGVWVHHPMMGVKLKEAMAAQGLECHEEEFPASCAMVGTYTVGHET